MNSMAKVFIDPGHGGNDPGAIGKRHGLQEKDIALSAGFKVGESLKRHGIDVCYTRTTDTFVELTERANLANKAGADIFVSIHCNSASDSGAQGVETYSYLGSSKGTILAKCIQDSIIRSGAYTKNRGIKTANFAVLRQTNMPAALVEMGFISNKEDAEILKNKQNELAESIAKGILDYVGVKYIKKCMRKTEETDRVEIDNPSAWAQAAWEWGQREGITDGSRPKDAATREEIMQMFYNFRFMRKEDK